MSLFDLHGKVCIVTGSSRGIGRAIALRMAEHGAKVVISSRKPEACETVAQEIRAAGGEAMVIACNIANKAELQALVDKTVSAWGTIDYDRIMGSNVRSNFWLCNMAVPHMVDKDDASIIVVSSIGGLRGSPTLGVYGLSKAADMQLVRNLAVEWGPRKVRANCIAPGLVKTDFAKALWSNPALLKKRTKDSPLQRIGEADEIAGTAIYMASKASTFLTGQTIVVDGGVTVGIPAQAYEDD
jgi:NAD(P)-dependent dehydrogenase (short-subunit alcohol dehydrogenase family)